MLSNPVSDEKIMSSSTQQLQMPTIRYIDDLLHISNNRHNYEQENYMVAIIGGFACETRQRPLFLIN